MTRGTEAGVFWIGRADYPEFFSICIDNALLPLDYDAWLIFMDEFMETRRAQGFVPVQVNIKLQEFIAWCRERRYPINGSARQAYATLKFIQYQR
jgi:hypothetical protein